MTQRRLPRKLFLCAVVSTVCALLQFALLSQQQTTLPVKFVPLDYTEIESDCLLQDACLDRLATKLSRVWPVRVFDSWCTNSDDVRDGTEYPSGLVLIKVPKSASSTLAGIVLRIQNRRNCSVHWEHRLAREYKWGSKTTVRVAPIREPSSRAMSSVYYHYVSFHKSIVGQRRPKDSFIIQKLSETKSNYILDYIADNPLSANVSNEHDRLSEVYESIWRIMNWYHFLFVIDRLDESLLIWSWLTQLPWTDLITMSSKRNGSWYLSGKRCVTLTGASITPAISSFLESVDWKRTHAGDRLLYQVANKSLDRTIDEVIGRQEFEENLVKFRELRRQIEHACLNQTNFPCSEDGSPQLELAKTNCYVRDFGCGYPCVDRYANEFMQ